MLTALLLCIVYRGENKNNNVIQQAKELGMVFSENETTSVEQIQEEPVTGNALSVVEEDVKNQESEQDKKARQKLEDSKKDIKNASAYQKGTSTFTVRSGLLSSSVAREMEEAGIIEDGDAFDDFLEKKGYGKLVRSGSYKIPKDADFETIAKIITRQD